MSTPLKNGKSGCLTILLYVLLICFALAIYSYAWIPAIGAIIFFVAKKDRLNRKRNIIISAAVAVTSLLLFIGMQSTPELTDIEVDWGTTEYTVSDNIEIKVTPVPSNAEIDTLEISENPLVSLEYEDGTAILHFESEGTATVFLKANGSIQSDTVDITVNPKEKENDDNVQKTSDDQIEHNMKVHFIDVGQGLSILVQSGDKTLIYDGGDGSSSSKVVAYLKDQNVKNIDYLISSHYDDDHLSGLIGCLNAFNVTNVIGADYVHDSQLYQSFMTTIEEKGLSIQHPNVGETFDLGSDQFTILSPKETSDSDSNNNSIAIKVSCGETSFIFTGDAEHSSEADMINSGIDLSCNVLCLGHHGSANSTSWDFLQKTVPEFAVISCGADNQYGHPDKDTLDKLSSMEIELFRTDKQGTIVVESDGKNLTWNAEPCNDYTPGDSADTGTTPAAQSSESTAPAASTQPSETQPADTQQGTMVWIPQSGTKYHSNPSCSGMKNPTQISITDAQSRGYEPCKKCY